MPTKASKSKNSRSDSSAPIVSNIGREEEEKNAVPSSSKPVWKKKIKQEEKKSDVPDGTDTDTKKTVNKKKNPRSSKSGSSPKSGKPDKDKKKDAKDEKQEEINFASIASTTIGVKELTSAVITRGNLTRIGLVNWLSKHDDLKLVQDDYFMDLHTIPHIGNKLPKLSAKFFRSDVLIPRKSYETLRKDLPGVIFGYKDKIKADSGHPTLRTYREYNRLRIYDDTKHYEYVLNVGDSGMRSTEYGMPHHCLAPIINDKDRHRHSFKWDDARNEPTMANLDGYPGHPVTRCDHTFEKALEGQPCYCNPRFHYPTWFFKISYEFNQSNGRIDDRYSYDINDEVKLPPTYEHDNQRPLLKLHMTQGKEDVEVRINIDDGESETEIYERPGKGVEMNMLDFGKEKAMIFIHSQYYINIDDIAKMMWIGQYACAYTLIHKFEGTEGSFFDEGYWTKEDDTITMAVREGSCWDNENKCYKDTMCQAYQHPSLDFMHNGINGKYSKIVSVGRAEKKIVWTKMRETSVDATFKMYLVDIDDLKDGVVADLGKMKKLVHERKHEKKRTKLIGQMIQTQINKYSLRDVQGISMQPIIREMIASLNKNGVTLDTAETTTAMKQIFKGIMEIKKEIAAYNAEMHLSDTLANQQMKKPQNAFMYEQTKERNRSNAMNAFLQIVSNSIDREFLMNVASDVTTNIYFLLILLTFIGPLEVHRLYYIETSGMESGAILLYYIKLAVATFMTIGAICYGIMHYFNPLDPIFKRVRELGEQWNIPKATWMKYKLEVKISAAEVQSMCILVVLIILALLPIPKLDTFTTILIKMGVLGLFYKKGYLISIVIAALQSALPAAQAATGQYLGETNEFTMHFIFVGMIIIWWYRTFKNKRVDVYFATQKPTYGEYEIGELIAYGECAKEHGNFWRDLAPESKLDYNKELFETDCTEVNRKPISFAYGVHLKDYKPRVSTNCVHNEVHCVTNRQLFDLEKYSKRLSFKLMDKINAWVDRIDDYYFKEYSMPEMGFEDWLNTIKDTVKRERAADSKIKRDYVKHKDSRVNAFIKKEMILGKHNKQDGSKDKYAARLVQSCSQYLGNAVGPYCYTMGKILKKRWSEGPVVYASGMNRLQLGKWYDDAVDFVSGFGKPVVYASDFSKFDKHHTEQHLELEFKLLNRFLKMSDETSEAIRTTLRTVGSMPKGTVYECPATRKSGYHDTTLGNTLLNGFCQLFTICTMFDIEFDELDKIPVRMVVLGDDCYIITTPHIADLLMKDDTLGHLGWDVKKEIGELYEHTFCSSVFMPSAQGTILTSLPGRVLGKVFCSHKQYVKVKQQKYYCNVVAKGLLCDNQHNPIISVMLERLIKLTNVQIKDNKLGFMRDYNHKYQSFEHITQSINTSERIFDFYLNRYNISPTEMAELVRYMDNIPYFKCGLSHPVIDKIIAVDIEADVEKHHVELERGIFWDVVQYTEKAPIDPFQWWDALYRVHPTFTNVEDELIESEFHPP